MKKTILLNKIFRIIFAVLSGIIALGMVVFYLLISSSQFTLAAIIAGVCTFLGLTIKSKWPLVYVIGGLVFLMYTGFAGAFSGDKPFQYPFQRIYADERCGFDVSFMPETLPDTGYSYSTDFMPSVLQGSGYYSVLVETDEKTVAQIKADAEKRAIEKVIVSDCLDEYTIEECTAHKTGTFQYISSEAEDKDFFVYIPYEAVKNPEGYRIYVAYTDYDFNHPDTRAYIINESTNTVIWSII